jgi:intein/homing endonuclease
MGEETARITVAETSGGSGGSRPPGETVSLPVVELLTGRGFVTGKSGAGKSILEGTPVYTESGRKPIEAVERGERVLSLDTDSYSQEFREVQETIEHTDDRLLRITLEDGTELVGTADHSFLTADGLEIVPVRGDELNEGMWMPLARELPSPGSPDEFEHRADARDTDLAFDGGVVGHHHRTERALSLTFETGRECGVYLASGSVRGSATIRVTDIDDGVRGVLEMRGYECRAATCRRESRSQAKALRSEFGHGPADKRLPDWVFDAPARFRAGLVSGYVDANGTVDEGGVTVMAESKSLIVGLAELLRQFGVSATVDGVETTSETMADHGGESGTREESRANGEPGAGGNGRGDHRLSVDPFCVERFRSVVDLSAPRAERLDALCERSGEPDRFDSGDVIPSVDSVLDVATRETEQVGRGSNKIAGVPVQELAGREQLDRGVYSRLLSELGITGRARMFGNSDVQWRRVASIEPLDGEQTVYDLDVAGNDNFLANGVFVHNSNSASVLVEKLLDNEFGLLIADIDGEYYGLKEEYEILHVGGDEECDIQVTTEHAGKLAELALEGNVPIILDVSSYLDESEAEALLTEVARSLFAKGKKQKQPFLLLVEEIHEYIPEQGSVGECGKMLIKIGKRGRKHGLGLCGISQRPADVKKDFITQCDWLLWHRLTWQNDTRVVRRILDGKYADAVENLDDGEGFLVTDWTEDVRRVQFQRKKTFDAGATPSLEDVERPDLKSVSDDLVSELSSISKAASTREDRIAELKTQLEQREQRIEELERDLRDARNLRDLADQLVSALTDHRPTAAGADSAGQTGDNPGSAAGWPGGWRTDDTDATVEANKPTVVSGTEASQETGDTTGGDAESGGENNRPRFSAEEVLSRLDEAPGPGGEASGGHTAREEVELELYADTEVVDDGRGKERKPGLAGRGARTTDGGATGAGTSLTQKTGPSRGAGEETETRTTTDRSTEQLPDEELLTVRELKAEVGGLETRTRRMLVFYREHGPASAQNAHFAVGGDGDRTQAYARNRTLRTRGLVSHVGRGRYDYRLRDRLDEELGDRIDDAVLEAYATEIEQTVLDVDS